jgi:hypothetical protein
VTQQFDSVEVDISKLRDYCLSEIHPRGRHKARVFRAALGLTAAEAEVLRQSLLNAVGDQFGELRATVADEYGERYELDFVMTTDVGSALIRSMRIVRAGERVLRFISCYVV